MPDESKQPWQPLSPAEIFAILKQADFPWWIAGGHAIEHTVGRSLRPHGDIDILLLRLDQYAVHNMLAGWDCWVADPPGTLRPWLANEVLQRPVADIWCRQDRNGPWRMQLMLDEGDREHWQSRRCALVTKRVADLGVRDSDGIPFLIPEVQLFYKAKAPRPKDEIDFAATLPLLSQAQKAWLADAIAIAYGDDHAWRMNIQA